jgi:hypothetical protein
MKKIVIAIGLIVIALVLWAVLGNSGEKKEGVLSSAEAIALAQAANSDLLSYPSDNLPPKRIVTEKTDNGWLLGFYMEGSGRPGILRAQCYMVSGVGEVKMTGEFVAGGNAGPQTLDLSICGEVSVAALPNTTLSYFIGTVTAKVKETLADYEKLGLGGRVDGFALSKTYPKLLPSDFIGVHAIGGDYSVEKGQLLYSGHAASNSAVLTTDGMKTLLVNLSKRFNLPTVTLDDVGRILEKLIK